MLSAKDLKITFNPGTPIETRALRGMTLEIPAGQFVTVIGSNGAGKSTSVSYTHLDVYKRQPLGAVALAIAAIAPAQAADQKSVAVTAIVEHPALDAVRDGVKAALKTEGFEEGKNCLLYTSRCV